MTIATTTELICFLVLSAVVVIGALGVVLLSNIVYSAFLLGGVFTAVAGLYLLLNASFVAMAFRSSRLFTSIIANRINTLIAPT